MTGLSIISPTIFSKVVKNNKCCGCGVCAGICPHRSLSMQFNKFGEYNPSLTGECSQCGLCEKACPFLCQHPDEDEIASENYAEIPGILYRKETGFFLNSYVGYAPNKEIRWNGVSGGIATWLTCQLLERQLVDYIVTVTPTSDPARFFKFTMVSSLDELRQCAGTVYYPVELSEVIQQILAQSGTYAVICLPCVSKALRRALANVPRLKERVKYIIGLACSEQKPSLYADYLIHSIKDAPNATPETIRFRPKRTDLPACTPEFLAAFPNDVEKRVLMRMKDWGLPQYQLGACFHCDDALAETADVVLMDAWLPQYEGSPAGHSIVLTRNPELDEILTSAPSLESIEISELVKSQLGALYNKKCAHYPRGKRPLLSWKKPHVTLRKLEKYYGMMRIRSRNTISSFPYFGAEQACRVLLSLMLRFFQTENK